MFDASIDWQALPIREGLVSLYKQRRIQRMPANAPLVDELLTENFLEPMDLSTDTFLLTPEGVLALDELLDKHWPQGRGWVSSQSGDPCLPGEVFERRWPFVREQLRNDLPHVLNQASLQQALLGQQLDEFPSHLLEQLPQVTLSRDRSLHLRGQPDVRLLRRHGRAIELQKLLRQLTELVLPERDFHQLKEMEGELPALVMTIEDRGLFLDMDLPDGLLALWVAPRDLELAGAFLRFLPHWVPHVHFGDLDHQGLVMAERLGRYSQRPVRRFIPDFWSDYLADFSMPVEDKKLGKGAAWRGPQLSVPIIRLLMEQQRWLPQAPLLLDARLYDALRQLMR